MNQDQIEEIFNNQDEPYEATVQSIEKLFQGYQYKFVSKAFFTYLEDIEHKNFQIRDLKIIEYFLIQFFKENIITSEEAIHLIENQLQSIPLFVAVVSSLLHIQEGSQIKNLMRYKNILCKLNLNELSMWEAHYYENYLTMKENIENKQKYQSALAVLQRLDYQDMRKKIDFQFNFFVNNLILVPTHLDLLSVITPWMLQLRLTTQEDIQLFQKMQEVLYSLGEKSPFILVKSLQNMLECLKYQNSQSDMIKPNRNLGLILQDIPEHQKQLCFLPALVQFQVKQDQWFQIIKNLVLLGTNNQITDIIKMVTKILINRKLFQVLFQIQDKLLHNMFVNLGFPKFRYGTLWMFQFYILGSPNNQQYISKFLKGLEIYLKKQTKDSELQLLTLAISIKYRLNEQNIFKDLLQMIDQQNQDLIKEAKEQILKYDWSGKFAQSLDTHSEKKILMPYKGLLNIGNSNNNFQNFQACYMNSLLQAFFMTNEFKKLILNLDITALTSQLRQKQIKGSYNVGLLLSLQRLFCLLLRSKRDIINPSNFRDTLPDFFRAGYAQHDSSELEKVILDQIDITLKNTQHKNLIKNTFEGQMKTTITCMDCTTIKDKIEPFVDLNIIIPEGEFEFNVQNLLQKSLNDEILADDNKYYCEKCSKHSSKAIKTHSIQQCSKNVILTLNRFYFDKISLKKAKINKHVEILENIEISNTYELYAMIIHRGHSVDYGHYFTYAKSKQIWNKFDDSTVTKIGSFKDIILSDFDTPYMLFYESIQKDQMEEEIKLSNGLQRFIEQDEVKYLEEQHEQTQMIQRLNQFQLPQIYFNFRRDDEDDQGNYQNPNEGRIIF